MRAALAPSSQFQFSGVRLHLEPVSTPCQTTELGAAVGSMEVGPVERRFGQKSNDVFFALPDSTSFPAQIGDHICGVIYRYSLGYDPGSAAVVFDASGKLLVAFSDAMPRTRAALPGWSFTAGPERSRQQRDEDYWHIAHDVEVESGGAMLVLEPSSTAQLQAPGGDFLVSAMAYRTKGRLPPWMSWLQKSGYGFVIVRIPR